VLLFNSWVLLKIFDHNISSTVNLPIFFKKYQGLKDLSDYFTFRLIDLMGVATIIFGA